MLPRMGFEGNSKVMNGLKLFDTKSLNCTLG